MSSFIPSTPKYPHFLHGGDCHCELCQNKFREWCKAKYGTLEKLNHAWWAHF